MVQGSVLKTWLGVLCVFTGVMTLPYAHAEIIVHESRQQSAQPQPAPASDAVAQPAFSAPKSLFSNQAIHKPVMLSATEAFKFKATEQQGQVLVQASVTPKHYLYQQKFAVQGQQALKVGQIKFDQKAEFEEDPEFGRVPVFHRDVNLTIPVQGNGKLQLTWQGCAKSSVCYPPEQFEFKVQQQVSTQAAVAPTPVTKPTVTTHAKPASNVSVKVTPLGNSEPIMATALPDEAATSSLDDNVREMSLQAPSVSYAAPQVAASNSMVSDPFGLAEHPWIAFGLLFLAGLGLAFTPCVLPMLPIVANLVATQHRRSAAHGFALSGAYAVGVASCYALLGALIALFGHQINLITWSQHPAILVSFALIFIALALHSFELFQIKLPHFLRAKVEKIGHASQSSRWSGSVLGCLVAGFLSAFIVSPCLSAPLAGVLLSVSTVGSAWLGAMALFCLGLGLGVPLMILGATEGKFLPKAGIWLNWVRRGFGLLLFGVALVLLGRVFNSQWMLLLWAVLAVFFALWFWVWHGRGWLFTKILALLTAVWVALLLLGAFTGATDPLRPYAALTAKPEQQAVETIYNLAQLEQYQQQHPRLLVELVADWCIACKVVERELFLQQPAQELQTWTRVKLDISKTTPESKAVLASLNIFGPPALIFYQDSQMVDMLLGEPSREAFVVVLQRHAE